MKGDISGVSARFPEIRIAFVVARQLEVAAARSDALEGAIAEVQSALRAAHALEDVGAMPGIAAWRTIYRAFGIKKTSYRSSVERLVRNVLRDRDLPRINGLVDCYNMISLKHVLPAGADDLGAISGDIGFREATGEESFIPLGSRGQGGRPAEAGRSGLCGCGEGAVPALELVSGCPQPGHRGLGGGGDHGAMRRRRRSRPGGGGPDRGAARRMRGHGRDGRRGCFRSDRRPAGDLIRPG